MNKTSIFLVEDHQIFLEALMFLLSQDERLQIVGTDDNVPQALKRINELAPDVVITDLSMPLVRGEDLIAMITKRNPGIKTIVLTMHKDEVHVRSSLEAGADAYVLKEDTHHNLVSAIEKVMNGESYVSPGICSNIIGEYFNCESASKGRMANKALLTTRERQVIKLIADGESNRSIASLLSISTKTVEKHRSNIMSKLNLHNTASLTKYAIDNDYV